jgi:acetolactate synthase small subunit
LRSAGCSVIKALAGIELALRPIGREIDMIAVELSSDEAEELRAILDDYLSDLRMEIVDTEAHDFRVKLKKRKELIEKLLSQLRTEKP